MRVCVRARARVCVCVCESVALTISRFLLMKLHVHVCVICRRLQCRGDCLLCVPLCLACIINYYLSVLVFALHTYTPAHKQTHTHTHAHACLCIRFQFEKCKVSCTCVRLMHSHELQRSMHIPCTRHFSFEERKPKHINTITYMYTNF